MEASLIGQRVEAIAKRSDAEIEALLLDVRPWLYRLALAVTGDPESAEDAAQETLIRAHRSKDVLAKVDEPKAWLRTILVRRAITAKPSNQKLDSSDRAMDLDPTESLAVRQTLARLSGDDRALLALAHFESLSYGEIAEILQIPTGTVASRLHAAREAFRKEWRK